MMGVWDDTTIFIPEEGDVAVPVEQVWLVNCMMCVFKSHTKSYS
jgi:hypothetical protein